MVFGGIIISSANLVRFDEAMRLFRDSQNMHAEFKWTKVSNQKIAEYGSLVDLFFSFNRAMHFKCIVIDTSLVDYKKYHKGNKELGFYKFFYQFLLHQFGSYMADSSRYLIRVHQRTTSYKLSTLFAILSRGLQKRYGLNNIVTKIEPISSDGCETIQVADVLMGAVGYHWNACHTRPNARRAKVLLADYIAQRAGILSLAQATPWGKKEFSIWPFRLRQKEK